MGFASHPIVLKFTFWQLHDSRDYNGLGSNDLKQDRTRTRTRARI